MRYVGFAVAVWAFSSAISSFVAGRAVKYVKRFTLFFVALGLSLFLCLLLIFFKRVESFPLVFLVSFGFGLSDGILKTGTSCECHVHSYVKLYYMTSSAKINCMSMCTKFANLALH